jgi:hypothetical protein
VELRCVRCRVENKRPPSIDDVIPHAVVYGLSESSDDFRLTDGSMPTSLKQERYLSLGCRLHKPGLPTWESMAFNLTD